MKKTLLLIFTLSFFNTIFAQEEIRVLWLGNSYTSVNNLPLIVNELSLDTDKTIISELVCYGGYTLFQHAVSETSLKTIRKGGWDYVVLQEQSQLPSIDYYRHNAMKPAYRALNDSIKLYNPDATVVGFMTWGREFGGQQCVDFGQGLYCSADFVDFNHMQDSMSAAYCENAYATDSYVAPAGDAWKVSLEKYPKIILHSHDQSHPTFEGSYLTACVFYAIFWKESPIGAYHSAQIDDEKALLLQTIASETVFNNLEKWNIETDTTNINKTLIEKYDFDIISNPNHDNIIIKNKNKKAAKLKVINIDGSIIKEKDFIDDEIITINNSKGIYIIQIIEKESKVFLTKKIIKL